MQKFREKVAEQKIKLKTIAKRSELAKRVCANRCLLSFFLLVLKFENWSCIQKARAKSVRVVKEPGHTNRNKIWTRRT